MTTAQAKTVTEHRSVNPCLHTPVQGRGAHAKASKLRIVRKPVEVMPAFVGIAG